MTNIEQAGGNKTKQYNTIDIQFNSIKSINSSIKPELIYAYEFILIIKSNMDPNKGYFLIRKNKVKNIDNLKAYVLCSNNNTFKLKSKNCTHKAIDCNININYNQTIDFYYITLSNLPVTDTVTRILFIDNNINAFYTENVLIVNNNNRYYVKGQAYLFYTYYKTLKTANNFITIYNRIEQRFLNYTCYKQNIFLDVIYNIVFNSFNNDYQFNLETKNKNLYNCLTNYCRFEYFINSCVKLCLKKYIILEYVADGYIKNLLVNSLHNNICAIHFTLYPKNKDIRNEINQLSLLLHIKSDKFKHNENYVKTFNIDISNNINLTDAILKITSEYNIKYCIHNSFNSTITLDNENNINKNVDYVVSLFKI